MDIAGMVPIASTIMKGLLNVVRIVKKLGVGMEKEI